MKIALYLCRWVSKTLFFKGQLFMDLERHWPHRAYCWGVCDTWSQSWEDTHIPLKPHTPSTGSCLQFPQVQKHELLCLCLCNFFCCEYLLPFLSTSSPQHLLSSLSGDNLRCFPGITSSRKLSLDLPCSAPNWIMSPGSPTQVK